MKNINKKIEKYLNKYQKAAKGEKVKVVTFKRNDFTKNLSTTVGFGYQDLKNKPKEIIKWLISENTDFIVEPVKIDSNDDFKVNVSVIKK
jgi:hypothetical protein